MHGIDLKGFYRAKNGRDFVAIAPVWLNDIDRQNGAYPANHYCFRGKFCGVYENVDHAPWNPENVHSNEAWLEVDLHRNRWEKDDNYGRWGITRRSWLGGYIQNGTRHPTHRFFLPREQLRAFYLLRARSPKSHEGYSYSSYEISHATCIN